MTATIAPSAAPLTAIRVWSDGTDILCEIPGIAGRPGTISKFSATEAGLAKVLAIIQSRAVPHRSAPHNPRAELTSHILKRNGILPS